MPLTLKNKNLKLQFELPGDEYEGSRFDWTGKIASVHYKGIPLTSAEKKDTSAHPHCGRGLYNEFGIDQPVGYDQAMPGELFHKIGIGLLRRDGEAYDFFKAYEVEMADFTVVEKPGSLIVECRSAEHLGFAYILTREFVLFEKGFEIRYRLENRGAQAIRTNEYCHNFLSLNGAPMDTDYRLVFPFDLRPDRFGQTVNPEGVVEIHTREIRFTDTPGQPFFFSNLSGGETVPAQWTLENKAIGLGISEALSQTTGSVNLWGHGHVVSPELFLSIHLEPQHTMEWCRLYSIFELD